MRNEQEKFKNKGTYFSINSTGTLNASGNHHTKAVDFTYYVLENFREQELSQNGSAAAQKIIITLIRLENCACTIQRSLYCVFL
jgi:hypothetical protein